MEALLACGGDPLEQLAAFHRGQLGLAQLGIDLVALLLQVAPLAGDVGRFLALAGGRLAQFGQACVQGLQLGRAFGDGLLGLRLDLQHRIARGLQGVVVLLRFQARVDPFQLLAGLVQRGCLGQCRCGGQQGQQQGQQADGQEWLEQAAAKHAVGRAGRNGG